MTIFAIFLGVAIGLLGWSFLMRFSYAVHDVTNKTSLATKLSDPNSGALPKMLWWAAATSLIWLMVFGGACLHFAYSDASKQFPACFLGVWQPHRLLLLSPLPDGCVASRYFDWV